MSNTPPPHSPRLTPASSADSLALSLSSSTSPLSPPTPQKKGVRFASPPVSFFIAPRASDVSDPDIFSEDEDPESLAAPSDDSDSDSDPETTTTLPLPTTTTPRRGLTRATRRTIHPHHSTSIVDELDLLNRIETQQQKPMPKSILKQPTPLAPLPAKEHRGRASRSNLLMSFNGTILSTKDHVPPSPRRSISRSSSAHTLAATAAAAAGGVKKKTLVSRTTFEQNAMFMNF
ncbi:hypothetical protein HDU98_011946 [Podochytrium sp. JEL0797]|nr:hypothetical protein HDU98_011946 [Podochytrium sp. JEL0797]